MVDMEVVAATPNGGGVSPFHNHDVREWSHVDSLTGVLERARRETNHWTTNTNNSSHKYGKVVDCRARSGVDGNLQQEARRQLEVFQSQIPGGRVQVIKCHTVSSSRWTNKFSQEPIDLNAQTVEDLQLNANPLDVTCQKSKASVGRSVGRRPPSRQQQRDRNEPTISKSHDASTANVHRVSRLCHHVHDNAVKHYIQKASVVQERRNSDENSEINSIETGIENNHHSKLTRTKSTSSENLHLVTEEQYSSSLSEKDRSTKSIDDLEDLEKLRDWRRTSKLRRSLQAPKHKKIIKKPCDLPQNNGSVRRIQEDIEKGRRLNTALRGNNINLEALDQILQTVTNPRADECKFEKAERDVSEQHEEESVTKTTKKSSFVTVESIKEVRDRLRRTGSPTKPICSMNKEETDDGIVTEDTKMSLLEKKTPSKMRSYIYGMENPLKKRSASGTGSLESRSKHTNNNSFHKNEDWYNRRKSYGFEKMYNQQEDTISKVKNMESSTDSGICRSSEVVIPRNTSEEVTNSKEYNNNNSFHRICPEKEDVESVTVNIPTVFKNPPLYDTKLLSEKDSDSTSSNSVEYWRQSEEIKRHSIAVDESKYILKNSDPIFRRTSLAVNNIYNNNEDDCFLLCRKPKKVEFCKTEVHFTAESGKVNIVETDEKPPPTNNFRRRRRNSGLILDEFNSNDLPVFQFGQDLSNGENIDNDNENEILQRVYCGPVTVNTTTNSTSNDSGDDPKENLDNELPKGILKNKLIKPKPYILGDSERYLYNDYDSFRNLSSLDIKLNPIKNETPMWRSTVSVKNSSFDSVNDIADNSDSNDNCFKEDVELAEFQRLLKRLKPVAKKPESLCESLTKSFNGIRIVSPNVDTKRSSLSVTNYPQPIDDQIAENRGYSTKVNFGNGETTVIENNIGKEGRRHPTWPRKDETSSDLDRMRNIMDTKQKSMEKIGLQDGQSDTDRDKVNGKLNGSPTTLSMAFSSRNSDSVAKFDVHKLSSPALVGKNTLKKPTSCDNDLEVESTANSKTTSEKEVKKRSLEKQSCRKLVQHVNSQRIRKEVLRQPKKSEMAYFGVTVSPKSTKKESNQSKLLEKPDLLQFTDNNKNEISNYGDKKEPVYENVSTIKKEQSSILRKAPDFDNSILEELTKAADQILQAVNGFVDEDKFSANEEEKSRNESLRDRLDTISESRSWKQTKTNHNRPSQIQSYNTKTKIKQTSSNSSIESVTKENRKSTSANKLPSSTSGADQKIRRKTTNSDNVAIKTQTKARRLQRASSREALLQSRGSSSEDLATVAGNPLRKPRLPRKTKSTTSTATNSLEIRTKTTHLNKKREDSSKTKLDSRVPPISLPEIRHKTAVSTIKSTAEKAAKREKGDKCEFADSKRKPSHKRDSHGTPGVVKNDKNRNSSARYNGSHHTSTANVKKWNQYEDLLNNK